MNDPFDIIHARFPVNSIRDFERLIKILTKPFFVFSLDFLRKTDQSSPAAGLNFRAGKVLVRLGHRLV